MPRYNSRMIDDYLNCLHAFHKDLPLFSFKITDRLGEKTFFERHEQEAAFNGNQEHVGFWAKAKCSDENIVKCHANCCMAFGVCGSDTLLLMSFAQPLNSVIEKFVVLFLKSLSYEIEHTNTISRLRAQTEFNEQIIQSISSGFLILSPDLTITNANPAACELLGVNMERLLGSRLSEFIFSKLLVEQIFIDGKPVIDREVVIKLANKNLRILKTAVPVFDKNGSVIAVLDHFKEIKEAHQLATRITGARANFTFNDIVHQSDIMRETIALSKEVAGNSLSVLITGESGTGKELFAHAIHMASQRKKFPFVVIDCASLPRDLVASELFGYVAGAFTGARKDGMPGKFELADGGTVFLDELGELPLEIQAQFLRVLQNREVMRLGSKDVIPIDIRIIAATNRNLTQDIAHGLFREDLFYRLNVININVPPLRSRPDDIILLANYFCGKYAQLMGKARVSVSAPAMQALLERKWPGNVRELENTIARAIHLADAVIEARHVQAFEPVPSRQGEAPLMRPKMLAVAPNATGRIKDVEQMVIEQTVAACGGNISKSARQLGISRSTIYKKMLAWGN